MLDIIREASVVLSNQAKAASLDHDAEPLHAAQRCQLRDRNANPRGVELLQYQGRNSSASFSISAK
jgi:hypothetical protein